MCRRVERAKIFRGREGSQRNCVSRKYIYIEYTSMVGGVYYHPSIYVYMLWEKDFTSRRRLTNTTFLVRSTRSRTNTKCMYRLGLRRSCTYNPFSMCGTSPGVLRSRHKQLTIANHQCLTGLPFMYLRVWREGACSIWTTHVIYLWCVVWCGAVRALYRGGKIETFIITKIRACWWWISVVPEKPYEKEWYL